MLMMSSIDGYCSVVLFEDGELGEFLAPAPVPVLEPVMPAPVPAPVVGPPLAPEPSPSPSPSPSPVPAPTVVSLVAEHTAAAASPAAGAAAPMALASPARAETSGLLGLPGLPLMPVPVPVSMPGPTAGLIDVDMDAAIVAPPVDMSQVQMQD
jgi:hypothetical protein